MTTERVLTLCVVLGLSCVPQFERGIWCDDDESCPRGRVCLCNRCEPADAGRPATCATGGGSAGGGAAGGTPFNVAGGTPCSPTTCAALDAGCGMLPDGCGQMLTCGFCEATQRCESSTLRCVDDSMAEAQILAVLRAAPPGPQPMPVSLPVTGAQVTFVKPAVAGAGPFDGPGFFVQAGQRALFVEAQVTPAPREGDVVSFVVSGVATINGHRRVVGLANFMRTGTSPMPVPRLALESFGPGFLRGDGESLAATLSSTLSTVTAPDAGYLVSTTDGGVNLRVSLTDNQSFDLRPGCTVRAAGPVWLTPDTVQVDAFSTTALESVVCPAPRLIAATASSGSQVRATASRFFDPGSVVLPGRFVVRERESMAPPLAVSGVSLRGPDMVEVSTSNYRPGFEYEVGVSATPPTDRQRTPFVPDSVPFVAGVCSSASVVISAFSASTTEGAWIELHNRTSRTVPLRTWVLGVQSTLGANRTFTFPVTASIAAGGYVLVQVGSVANTAGVPPDVTGTTLQLQAQGGSIYVGPAALSCDDGLVVDRVTYGSMVGPCAELPQLAAIPMGQVFRRADGRGCIDTPSNVANFVASPLTTPRNSSVRATTCVCP
jgi:hypothetical protein